VNHSIRMSTLSSGYTNQLQRKALYCDRQVALEKVKNMQQSCYKNVNPIPTTRTNCSGQTVVQNNQQASSSAANRSTYTPRSTSGVPESVRIQKLQTLIADSSINIPFRNSNGRYSFTIDTLQRFNEYKPYQPPPCAPPLPILATNAGNPIPSIPPCNGPKVLF